MTVLGGTVMTVQERETVLQGRMGAVKAYQVSKTFQPPQMKAGYHTAQSVCVCVCVCVCACVCVCVCVLCVCCVCVCVCVCVL